MSNSSAVSERGNDVGELWQGKSLKLKVREELGEKNEGRAPNKEQTLLNGNSDDYLSTEKANKNFLLSDEGKRVEICPPNKTSKKGKCCEKVCNKPNDCCK